MPAPGFVDMLKTLIEEPSVSCTRAALDQSNLAVIHHLAGWLEDLGFAVDVIPLPNNSAKANLIAQLGSGAGGLVLAGHTDTVPCDESLWTCNPFRLAEHDNRFYGLGTCDMKGFFPLAIDAARELRTADLTAPLIVLATSDEESSMAGARALMAEGRPDAACAVIGEPTNMMPGVCTQRFHDAADHNRRCIGSFVQSRPWSQRAGYHALCDERIDSLSRPACNVTSQPRF